MTGSAAPSSVVRAARRLVDTGLCVGRLGNVSVRDGDRIWITPTAVPPYDMAEEDVVPVDVASGLARSDGRPSRELPLHLGVYRSRRAVGAVVHTHSPWATAWSHLERDLDLPTEELGYYGLSRIPCCAWQPAGSEALGRTAQQVIAEGGVALLARHGAVAAGPSLGEALELASLLEHQAQLQWLLSLAGDR